MVKSRNLYIDVLKAISIILVVVGHCIQYGSGVDYLRSGVFLYDPVFIFIYSFHMPLFMLISGYLFAFSCKSKSCKDLLIAKFKQIIIPLLCWSFVTTAVQIIKVIIGISSHKISLIWIGQTILASFWGGPWFLWAIWWCSLVVIIGRKFFKDSILFYLLICLISYVTPDDNNLAVYKFMLPFFLLAYLFNAYDLKDKLKKIYTHRAFGYCCLIAFTLLIGHYNFDSFIYTTGYSVIGKNLEYQLHNNSFRFVIGLVGSLAVMCFTHAFMDVIPYKISKILAYIGASTLGIYVISNYLFDEVLKLIPMGGLDYRYVAVESVCVLGISLLINAILKKFKITNKLFLGGR